MLLVFQPVRAGPDLLSTCIVLQIAIDGKVAQLCPLGGLRRPHASFYDLSSMTVLCSMAHKLSPIRDVSLGPSGLTNFRVPGLVS
jgi:hypothetical protein